MATRKAITLVSGLFQEVNTPTDKLDFAGNTTADLAENTNLYFTNTRARSAVSVTDAGGLGSLAYNSSTGVITYTGPSNSDIRGLLSIASGSGLTYNSSTGEFGTSAIPNAQLANDDVTVGSTAIALGATATTIVGLSSLTSDTLKSGSGSSNVITIASGNLLFSGATGDANGTTLTVTDPTATRTITLPDETGTVLTTGTSIANSNLANSTFLIGGTTVALGGGATTFTGFSSLQSTTLVSGTVDGANSITLASGNITFEGSTADGNEIILTAADASGSDKTITLPNATGTVALLNTLSIASGSGLTYNSGTGEFSTNAIPNAQLANSSVTVGSTAIALGNSSTTLAGLSSVTSTAVITDDSGFRIRDNSDNTKQLAFECSGISGSTTRTLTAPDASGTIATQAYVNAQVTAEDLDVQTDSGNFDVDLDSEALILTGGTGIDTSGSGTTATFAIDSTVATLTGSQTLTNKTLTSAVLNGTISGTSIKDEDNMASDSASHLCTQQSIKAFVESQAAGVTGVTAGDALSGGGSSGTVTLNVSGLANAQVASDAAIAGTKISPDFGSQTVTTTGTVNTGVINASTSSDQILNLNSSDSNAVYLAYKRGGSRKAYVGYGGTGNTLSFVNEISDGDINISGSDGGSQINVLNFDVSDTGKATFSGAVHASNGFVGNVTGNASGSSGSCTGNAATATALETARNIGGVSFDGTGNINLPGVNTSGNQNTSGTAAIATTVTVADESSDTSCNVLFATAATGNLAPKSGTNLTFNSSSGVLTATGFAGALTGNVTGNASGSSGSCTGNAATATALETARTIAGVSFDGTANISLNNNAITNGAGYITATLTNEQVQDIVGGMLTGNTETGITVTYQDGDGTIDFVVASQTENDFTTTLKNKLDGIAASATNVTNNNQLTNGASYVTSSIINSLSASNLSSGTIPDARFPSTLPAVDGSNLTGISAGATGGGSDEVFYENGQTVTTNYTITNGKNAMAAGPITINSGVTVTVGSGETLTIV